MKVNPKYTLPTQKNRIHTAMRLTEIRAVKTGKGKILAMMIKYQVLYLE